MNGGFKARLWDVRWHALLVVNLVPVVIAVVVLQLLGPLGGPLSRRELDLFKGVLSAEPFLAGVLSLVAVLTVHVCICASGIVLAWTMIRRLDRGRAMLSWGMALAALVGLAVVGFAWWSPDGRHGLTVYRMTYDFFRNLYARTGADASLLHPRLMGLDALGWSMLIPILLGIVGVGALSAAAAAELRELPEPPHLPDRRYEGRLQEVQGRLKRSLQLLTLGLVASTVAVSLFFHLPLKLSQNSFRGGAPALTWPVAKMTDAQLEAATARAALVDKAAAAQAAELGQIRGKLDDYAGELTIYWGAVFTLTLLAAGALPLIALERKVQAYSANSRNADAVSAARERLGKSGLLSSGFDQVKLVAAVIAPLASGQVAGLVQSALGS